MLAIGEGASFEAQEQIKNLGSQNVILRSVKPPEEQKVSDKGSQSYVLQYGITYPNIRDPSDDVARAWGLTGLPETFFISRRGKVVAHVIGAISDGALRRGLAAAALGRPLAAVQGGARRRTH